ncbi:hypothetical protein Bca4012_072487 [Brassica carinata]
MELRRRPFDVRCFWSPHSLRSSAEKLNRESPNKVDSSSSMSLHELLNFTDQTCMYNLNSFLFMFVVQEKKNSAIFDISRNGPRRSAKNAVRDWQLFSGPHPARDRPVVSRPKTNRQRSGTGRDGRTQLTSL